MKHFIDINNFKKKEIDEIISLAKKIKKNPKKYSTLCRNQLANRALHYQLTRDAYLLAVFIMKCVLLWVKYLLNICKFVREA